MRSDRGRRVPLHHRAPLVPTCCLLVGDGLDKVNAASVKADGAFDVISAADVLLIAQRAVGLRGDCFNLLPAAAPPAR